MAKCLWNEYGYEYSEQHYGHNDIVKDTRTGKLYKLTGIDSNERTYFITVIDTDCEFEIKWAEIYEYYDVVERA